MKKLRDLKDLTIRIGIPVGLHSGFKRWGPSLRPAEMSQRLRMNLVMLLLLLLLYSRYRS